jgi:hypothetical protein
MAKALSFSPLQLFTPIQLIFCLILFFLPWIDVQCVVPKDVLKDAPKEKLEEMKKEIGWDPNTPFSFATQSGLQIANGDASPGADMQRVMDKLNKELGGKGNKEKFDFDTDPATGKKTERKTAPLLFFYPVALVAGIVIGFIPWAGWARRIVLASVVGGAFLVVGVQAVMGFPIEVEMKKKFQEASGSGMGGFGPFGGLGGNKTPGGKAAPKSEPKLEDVFRVAWKFPLYVTFLLLLTAGGTSFLDAGGGGKKSRYGKRKRGRDDYDDEEDEEDDDEDYRPAKKKRRDADDEDDDDRPARKKKRRDDDEDEDEDEDEDDRPRKKKVVARVRDDDEDEVEKPVKKPKPAFEVVSPPPPPPAKSGSAPGKPAGPPPAAPRPSGQRPALPRPPSPPPPAPKPVAFDLDDDDEPKPRKKRPRDDDDDDDRPGKKRRRDDD